MWCMAGDSQYPLAKNPEPSNRHIMITVYMYITSNSDTAQVHCIICKCIIHIVHVHAHSCCHVDSEEFCFVWENHDQYIMPFWITPPYVLSTSIAFLLFFFKQTLRQEITPSNSMDTCSILHWDIAAQCVVYRTLHYLTIVIGKTHNRQLSKALWSS